MSGPARSSDPIDADEHVPTRGPRFCPRCGRETGGGEVLCSHCGETPQAQGFCGVCERFWRLPVGDDCPKHDMPLDVAPRPPAFDDPGGPGTRWVTLRTFSDSTAAEAPRLRLEAEGIPTFLEGARMGSQSMYQIATGGVKLQVPQPLAADARVLLDQTWAPPTHQDDDLDDAWEELAPEPGVARRSVMKGAILLILFGPLALYLLARLLGI